MNKLLIAGLIGGAIYWLLKEPAPAERRLTARPEPDFEPEDEQDLLDEALEESFPASDSPAVTPPRH